jgi:hypothetical protein
VTPERERELAKTLANDLALAAISQIDAIEAYDYLADIDPVPELAAMGYDDRMAACDRIAALARTATVAIDIPAPAGPPQP